MNDSKLNDMIRTSLESIREIADADTIIGKPIDGGNGTVIVPVSKVSMGFASGGVDFFEKNDKARPQAGATSGASGTHGKAPSFGGGGGTGLTINPICFIVTKPNGDVEILNVSTTAAAPAVGIAESVTDLLEKSPDIISRIKAVFAKKDPDADTDSEQ